MVDEHHPAPTLTRRRALLGAGAGAVGMLLPGCGRRDGQAPAPAPHLPGPTDRFAELERRFGGRLGVAALDTATGRRTGWRGDERFLMCSTVKVAVVAAVLHRSVTEPGLLDRRLRWSRADLLSYAPVTRAALDTGLTVAGLCDAALTVSDNTAVNLLSGLVGGPPGVTGHLRGLGDAVSRADRPETALNARAGDLDTTTPAAFVATLRTLALGAALPPPQRDRLLGWMRANTTGDAQIRAGAPRGWTVADKTGSGDAGESNDVGVVWPPGRPPVVLAVYTAPADPTDQGGKATIAAATRESLAVLGVSR